MPPELVGRDYPPPVGFAVSVVVIVVASMAGDHVLAAAASTGSDRSWEDFRYDVGKNVASALFVALMVAVISKAIGFQVLARVRWRVLIAIAVGLPASLVLGFAVESFVPFVPAELVAGTAIGGLFAWGQEKGWLEPNSGDGA